MPRSVGVLVHQGVPHRRFIQRLAEEFVAVVAESGAVEYPGLVHAELLPVFQLSKAFGWCYAPSRPRGHIWIHVPALDPRTAPEWMHDRIREIDEQALTFEGPWLNRLFNNFAHELGHAAGASGEDAAWRRGEAMLSAALDRSSLLRKKLGR